MNEGSRGPIRVLHVVGAMNMGGAENRIMDIYRAIDKSKVQFDFLVTEKGRFDEEIEALGGKIFYVKGGKGKQNRKLRYKQAKEICKKQAYGVFHMHVGVFTGTSIGYYRIFKKNKAKKIFIHARSASSSNRRECIKHCILRYFIWHKCVQRYAVSREAGIWLFGGHAVKQDKVNVIKNAIDSKKFLFDAAKREALRRKLSLSDELVVGHVGRFVAEKNHNFLLNVFTEVLKDNGKARLLLVGDGPLKSQTEAKAKALGIANNVIFAGEKSNTQAYYQAMDVFCFPSIFEGLPGTVLEAQAAGLSCVISDTITSEVRINPNVKVLSLKASAEEWAMQIFANTERTKTNYFPSSGYDVQDVAKYWEDVYTDIEPECRILIATQKEL